METRSTHTTPRPDGRAEDTAGALLLLSVSLSVCVSVCVKAIDFREILCAIIRLLACAHHKISRLSSGLGGASDISDAESITTCCCSRPACLLLPLSRSLSLSFPLSRSVSLCVALSLLLEYSENRPRQRRCRPTQIVQLWAETPGRGDIQV